MVTVTSLHGSKVLHKHLINFHNLRMSVKLFLFNILGCAQGSVLVSGRKESEKWQSWLLCLSSSQCIINIKVIN